MRHRARRGMARAWVLMLPLVACADYQVASETVVADGGAGALKDAAEAVGTIPSDGGGAELVKKLNQVRDVHADSTGVYWSRDPEIEYCPWPCTASGAIWAAPGPVPTNRRFAFVPPANSQPGGTFFFGASSGSSSYMAKHTLLTSTPLNVGPAPVAIVADRFNAYFSSGSAIFMMGLAFTTSTKWRELPVPAEGMAVSPNALFWHTTGQGGAGGAGGVYGCQRAFCAGVAELVSPQTAGAVGAIYATTTDLYYAENTSGGIYSCPANPQQCAPTLIASGELPVGSIVVGNGYIYWSHAGSTVSATGMIRGCKLGACSPTTLASNLPRPVAMSASAANGLYVAAYGLDGQSYSGGIYRIPKLK